MFYICIVLTSLTNFGIVKNKEGKICARQLEKSSSLDEIKKLRRWSIEIIVDENGNIVKDRSWLWDWEIKDKKSYAMKCIKDNLQVEFLKAPFF